ncbi:MAG: ribonuclease domain-containing protein, partial [Planctomycetota bacterium]
LAATAGGDLPADPLPTFWEPEPVVENARIVNFDRVIYTGPVDLSDTLARIALKRRFPHNNDGSVFQNRERRLPQRRAGHYREYVHPTDGVRGPGPQRLVVGAAGRVWYTGDHYDSFREIGSSE